MESSAQKSVYGKIWLMSKGRFKEKQSGREVGLGRLLWREWSILSVLKKP